MGKYAKIGSLETVSDIKEIQPAFRRDFCVAVSVQQPLPEDAALAIQQMTIEDVLKLRDVEILGDAESGLTIKGPNRPARPLTCPSVQNDFALPQAVVAVVAHDHLDYQQVTRKQPRSRFHVGRDPALPWHSDKILTAWKPAAHRDLSGKGMHIASAKEKIGLSISSDQLGSVFFSAATVEKHVQTGELTVRQQQFGERFYFIAGFLHRSHVTGYETDPEVPQLRLLTF